MIAPRWWKQPGRRKRRYHLMRPQGNGVRSLCGEWAFAGTVEAGVEPPEGERCEGCEVARIAGTLREGSE